MTYRQYDNCMTPEFQFLTTCCTCNHTISDIEKIRSYLSQVDHQPLTDIVPLAHIHGVFPLVYHALHTHAADLLSTEFLAELKQYNRHIVMQNMRMTAELIRITQLFADHGIQLIAFKGPALAQLAYKDITLRQYTDLDILIKKQDIAKAIALLTNENYLAEINLVESIQETFYACVNVIGFEKAIRIELHWELLAKNYAVAWKEVELWQSNDTTHLNAVSIPILSYNTHLLYLCVHGSKHLFERLEWICDIDRFITAKPDLAWQTLLKQAQEKGLERMLLLSLYLCHQLLALPLPTNIRLKVLNDLAVKKLGAQIIKLNFSGTNTQNKSYRTFYLLWQMRENFTDRLLFTYRGLFSPKFDDFKDLALPKQLRLLYPLIRPIRLLAKYFRN